MPEKIIRVDLTEEEANFVCFNMNLTRDILVGDWVSQLQDTAHLKHWLSEGEGRERLDRINAFRVRYARLVVGDERVEQIIKDMESEASAKGFHHCKDCGGFHA